jgi:hypothetical protein
MGSRAAVAEPEQPSPVLDSCPLSARDQTRNLLLVATNTGLSYLASPVLYVGVVQAALCKELGASDTVCNLPGTAYLVLAAMPLFVAWYFPYVRLVKHILVTCYGTLALISALVVGVLFLPVPDWLKIAVVIAQGGVVGGARTVAVAFEFEVLGLGVSESRRGTALGLAYGVGPVLAIVGSLACQLLLTGTLGPLVLGTLAFPVNFQAVFAASVPIMALGAFLSSRFIIPRPAHEPIRQPFLTGVFGGFGKFLGSRPVLLAMIVAVLMLAGYTIISNMTLYTKEILGEAPSQYAGYQNTVRFACKAFTGVLLGWLLTRTHPKAGVLITATAGLAAVLWALAAPRQWFVFGFGPAGRGDLTDFHLMGAVPVFLLSFGLLGAGELFGIYVTNYILCCSPKAQMRRYMAFTMLTLFPAAPAGVLFGWISDQYTHDAPAFGFRLSFAAAAVFICVGILLALLLPARPRPEEEATA